MKAIDLSIKGLEDLELFTLMHYPILSWGGRDFEVGSAASQAKRRWPI
jgi:hypothetical protein